MKRLMLLLSVLIFGSFLYAADKVQLETLLPDVYLITDANYDNLNGNKACSLHCGHVHWLMRASSELKSSSGKNYGPKNVDDWSFKTAWVEGNKNSGKGEYLTFIFPRTTFFARDLKPLNWDGFSVVNGDMRDKNAWNNNGRVKTFRVYLNGQPLFEAYLEDEMAIQTFSFAQSVMLNPDDVIEAEIVDVYPGAKFKDTAVSEFMLLGAHKD
ncbi:MAG TPA: hypothetical protein PKJ42_00990 [Candidatus Goldiibacteriota bacterium]|nr:hypothetical protein [Candidatus Goldiibacteriota bacterium]